MIDAYEIGIQLALHDGVTAGLELIKQELSEVDRAIAASNAGLAALTQQAERAARAVGTAAGVRLPVPVAAQPASEPEHRPEIGSGSSTGSSEGVNSEATSRATPPTASGAPPPIANTPVIVPAAHPQSTPLPASRTVVSEHAGPDHRASEPTVVSAEPREPTQQRREPQVIVQQEVLSPASAPVTPATSGARPPLSGDPQQGSTPASAPAASRGGGEPRAPAAPTRQSRPVQASVILRAAAPPGAENSNGIDRSQRPLHGSAEPAPKPAGAVAARELSMGASVAGALRRNGIGSAIAQSPGLRQESTQSSELTGSPSAPAGPSWVSAPVVYVEAPPVRTAAVPGLTRMRGTGTLETPAAPQPQPRERGDGGGGSVMLDGRLVGYWLAEQMAREAARPPGGTSFFDPRQSPAWTPSGAIS